MEHSDERAYNEALARYRAELDRIVSTYDKAMAENRARCEAEIKGFKVQVLRRIIYSTASNPAHIPHTAS